MTNLFLRYHSRLVNEINSFSKIQLEKDEIGLT
jgi:hypothetical protein